MNNRIRIAIQKSGRLSDESIKLLGRCGVNINPRKEQLFCHSVNFPLDVLLVRDDDIPSLVADGICDYGIVGTNVLEEKSLQCESDLKDKVEITRYLGFAICRLAIALPKNMDYENFASLTKRRIATTYPNLLKQFITKHQLEMVITTLKGSVEIAPRLGIADCICDLVSTGATLEANYLREVQTVFDSQAVLIRSRTQFPDQKQRSAEIFQNRVQGAELANGSKYIMLHAPKSALAAIVEILPGVERPTIMALQGDVEKVAVHALCGETVFWETLEKLKMAGASSILVLPVEKIMA